MKINAKITLLFSERGMSLEIHDEASGCLLLEGTINPEGATQALGRLARAPFDECEVFNLDKIGKQQECKTFKFQLPAGTTYMNQKEVAKEIVHSVCPDGWEADDWFNSRDSFKNDGDTITAVTMIRSWVDPTAPIAGGTPTQGDE